MAIQLDTYEELRSRRKDYRILHRKLLATLRYEYSDFNIMKRYFTGEKPPNVPELAKGLNVSEKTIRRHMGDISESDLMMLTGMYFSIFKNRKPDDFLGLANDLFGVNHKNI